MAEEQDKITTDILAMLNIGKNAKAKMYHTFLIRLSKGETLNGSDLKVFDTLSKELKEQTGGAAGEKDAEKPAPTTQTLKNLLSVVRYLKEQGYKIGKSAVYKHQQEGKIRPNKDGVYALDETERYAATYLKKSDGTTPASAELDKKQREKVDEETRKIKAQAEHWEIRTSILKGSFVPRELFEHELAARATIFRSDIENFIRGQAQAAINLVSGDQNKAPDLIDFMLGQLEVWLARYTEKEEFKVNAQAYERLFEKATADELEDGDDIESRGMNGQD
jgi:hypothetical protein